MTKPASPKPAEEPQKTLDSPERGASIIKTAIDLMKSGQAKGWSHALEQARREASNSDTSEDADWYLD